jgi:hypothetical protein
MARHSLKLLTRCAGWAGVLVLPGAAWATTVNPVPEPASWWLAGIAAVAAIVVTIRNRRK